MTLIEALLASLLLGLGTARASAIIAVDKISEPLRDLIFHWYPPEDDDARGFYYQGLRPATHDERSIRGNWDIPWWQKRWEPIGDGAVRPAAFLGKLLSCHKCVGVWVAVGNTALYFAWREAALALNVLLTAALVSSIVNTHFYKD